MNAAKAGLRRSCSVLFSVSQLCHEKRKFKLQTEVMNATHKSLQSETMPKEKSLFSMAKQGFEKE